MTVRSMATTGCTVELLEVPRKMTATKIAPITFSTSPCDPLRQGPTRRAPLHVYRVYPRLVCGSQ